MAADMAQQFRFGWKRDALDHRDIPYSAILHAAVELPSKYIQPWSRPIQNQGDLGSCTGHGVERAVQNMRLKEGFDLQPYSRLQIYYDERVLEGTEAVDCGAQIRDGIKVVAKKGAILEDLWPYDVTKFAVAPPAADYATVELAVAYQSLNNTRLWDLKHCLAITKAPIVFGFTVFSEFQHVGADGLLAVPDPTGDALGGHCVVMEGYDDSQKAFWVANSWGTQWGAQGYFWLPYTYACDTRLASDFWSISFVQNLSN